MLISLVLLSSGIFSPYNGMNAPKRVVYHHLMVTDTVQGQDINTLFVSSMDVRDISNKPYSDLKITNATDSRHFHWGFFSSGAWENIEPLGKTCRGVMVNDVSLIPHDVPAPTVKIVEQIIHNNTRELELEFHFTGAHWGSIRWNASLEKWSVDEKVPQALPDGTVYIRHIGAHSSRSFRVRVHTSDMKPIAMDLTSTHFGLKNKDHWLLEQLPDWMTAIAFRTHATSYCV
eukprot:jgi/Galph1/351/GphlegSOOS_G5137.1